MASRHRRVSRHTVRSSEQAMASFDTTDQLTQRHFLRHSEWVRMSRTRLLKLTSNALTDQDVLSQDGPTTQLPIKHIWTFPMMSKSPNLIASICSLCDLLRQHCQGLATTLKRTSFLSTFSYTEGALALVQHLIPCGVSCF